MGSLDVKLTKEESNVRKYLINEFYIKNDKAHQIDHVDNVWSEFCRLANKFNYKLDRKVSFLGVYLHDIFSDDEYRDIHNIKAYRYVIETMVAVDNECPVVEHTWDLDCTEITTIANMVLYHRASIKIDYDTFPIDVDYITLIRAADKGIPIFEDALNRTLEYNKAKNKAIDDVINHLRDKFGVNGYLWENDTKYKELYKDEYEQFQLELTEYLKDYMVSVKG